MKKWEKFSKEEIEQIAKDSRSFRDLSIKLGYKPDGGSGITEIKKMVETLSLDVSHFTGQGWNKNKIDLSKYVYGTTLQRGQALRDLIILRGHKCEDCGLYKWKNEPIPLQVHHKDGDYMNSELDNLQLLCPNCHALTENYGSKNKRKEVEESVLVEALKTSPNIRQALIKVGLTAKGKNYDRCYDLIYKYNIELLKENTKKKENRCEKCRRPLSTSNSNLCQSCIHEQQRKCEWPSREELKKKIFTMSFLKIAEEYNISDNAVRNWCKNYSLPYKKSDIKKYTLEEWEKV